jgi:hypothetical protein
MRGIKKKLEKKEAAKNAGTSKKVGPSKTPVHPC